MGEAVNADFLFDGLGLVGCDCFSKGVFVELLDFFFFYYMGDSPRNYLWGLLVGGVKILNEVFGVFFE